MEEMHENNHLQRVIAWSLGDVGFMTSQIQALFFV